MTNEEFQRTILSELREFKRETEKRFDAVDQKFVSIDQRFDAVDQKFVSIDQRFDAVDQRLDVADQRCDSLEQTIKKMDRKLDIITEQTAGLLEFRTEVNQKLDQFNSDQRSIMHVLGEHEVAIQTLQRRPV